MATRFRVSVLEFTRLAELEGARSDADLRALLDKMEFGDTSGMGSHELREMCLMSLQDLEPPAAAAVVLGYDLGEELRPGQITQMSHAMVEEKLWEEYPEMALHERLFRSASLLYAAFPQVFPETDAVRATLTVAAENQEAQALLTGPLEESFVVRLLADGLPERAILPRLFEDQLTGTQFPEAASIIWTVTTRPHDEGGVELEIVSAGYWLDALRETRAYTSSAYPDDVPDDAPEA